MKKLFVDTGAWYALVDKNDPDHIKAKGYFKTNKLYLISTNFIFDEIITLLRSRLGWRVAKDFGKRLKDSNFVSLTSVRNEDEERGWEIFLQYKDKSFSYTDCTSFAVMERLRLSTVFSFDKHFHMMKFQVVPVP